MTEAFKRGFMDKMAEFEKQSAGGWRGMFIDPVVGAANRAGKAVAGRAGRLFGRGGAETAAKAAPKITVTPEEIAAAKVPSKIKITPEEIAAAKATEDITRTPEQLAALDEMTTKRTPGLTQGRRPLKSVADLRRMGPDQNFSPQDWIDIDNAVRTAMAGKHIQGDEDIAALAADRLTGDIGHPDGGRALAHAIMRETEPSRQAKHGLALELGRSGDYESEPFDVSKLLIGDGLGEVSAYDKFPLISPSGEHLGFTRDTTAIPLGSAEIVSDNGIPNWKASLEATKKYWDAAGGARGAYSDQSPEVDKLVLDYLESRINRGAWPDAANSGNKYMFMPYPRQTDLTGWTPATEAIENLGREGMPGWRPALFESYTK